MNDMNDDSSDSVIVKARSRAGDREQRVLAAARRLGLSHGLRAVTMEAIAREAGIAKPTLYKHFASKDDVFAGVMEALIAEMTAGFDAALAADGPVIDRVADALVAKHGAAFRLLEGSPHAGELYGAHDHLAGVQFKALETLIRERLTDVLSVEGMTNAEVMVPLLMAAVHGIAMTATTLDDLRWGIEMAAHRLLGPDL